MRRSIAFVSILAGFVLASLPTVSSAVTLLVGQGAGTPINEAYYYYGGSRWTELTSEIDRTFDVVTVAPDLTDIDQILSYDRLWVDSRSFYGPNLSSIEVSNIRQFIATGRRVVLMGERGAAWSTSVLEVVGGTWGGEGRGIGPSMRYATALDTVPELTAGVGSISFELFGVQVEFVATHADDS